MKKFVCKKKEKTFILEPVDPFCLTCSLIQQWKNEMNANVCVTPIIVHHKFYDTISLHRGNKNYISWSQLTYDIWFSTLLPSTTIWAQRPRKSLLPVPLFFDDNQGKWWNPTSQASSQLVFFSLVNLWTLINLFVTKFLHFAFPQTEHCG